jgi:hypothetical protein
MTVVCSVAEIDQQQIIEIKLGSSATPDHMDLI